ncbi:MAG: class I SAM-dependent methyltransferase [Acidimicrobiia bacterium]
MAGPADRARGIWGVLRSGNARARALSIRDSRSFVRTQFLAAAVRVEVLPFLRVPRTLDDIARHLESTRVDRLEAFLAVGVELGELGQERDTYVARGLRSRAIATGDALLTAHYRSMLDYQTGPYAALRVLLDDAPGAGLSDLEEHATVIAEVSLAATPFVLPFLERVVTAARPERALDVGCGTGVYVDALLAADPNVAVDGIDLAPDVIDLSRQRVRAAGNERRATLHVGDVRTWQPPDGRRYGVITLINNVYYFAPEERVALYRRLGTLLTPRGELVIVTMLWPGSVASAHLHFMLVTQAGEAALPAPDVIEADLGRAGFAVVERETLVPTEPFVGVRARLA